MACFRGGLIKAATTILIDAAAHLKCSLQWKVVDYWINSALLYVNVWNGFKLNIIKHVIIV